MQPSKRSAILSEAHGVRHHGQLIQPKKHHDHVFSISYNNVRHQLRAYAAREISQHTYSLPYHNSNTSAL
jgi:hypothetical protein